MKKITQSNLQIRLISLALLFLIPITLSLAINFLFPKVSQQKINSLQEDYVQKEIPNFNKKDFYTAKFNPSKEGTPSIYEEKITEWKTTDEYQKMFAQNIHHDNSKMALFLIVITLLLLSLYIIPIAILKSSIIAACLYLYANLFLLSSKNTEIIVISSLLFLIIITHQAYQDK